jgi:[ribosomal protein S5]-alanine N-acetyltransferase
VRVSLTDFTPADAVLVHRWFNTPQALEGLVQYREDFGEQDARDWVDRALSRNGRDRKWTITLADRPSPVGFTALYGLGGQAAPELGILIGEPEVWGQGVGTEAQRLTIRRAFDEFDAHRVVEQILAGNSRARHVVERLGFELEGIMRGHVRRRGTLLDVAVYGLSREAWRG